MKRGFTLIEMLVVVVVISVLMTITFRLSSIGDDSSRRTTTVARLNRIENCLSGYNAAFGSYPPVALHGTRNIYASVNDHGIQSDDQENRDIWGWKSIGETDEQRAWEQVKAACKSQPVACRFPFPEDSEWNTIVKTVSAALQKRANSSNSGLSQARKTVLGSPFDNGVTDNMGRHDSTKSDWRDSQLFQFGLMSYLLPRYLVMMNSDENFFRGGYRQWEQNNALPCNPLTGFRFNGWQVVRDRSRSTQGSQLAEVANIPSQAVTARWMPNLEGIVCCNHDYKLFGISIHGETELRPDNADLPVFSPGGYESGGGTANQFTLDAATVWDGWGHEFYYYSPAPYQTYTLWSSGGWNDRTFPPWISRKSLTSEQNKKVGLWVEDDIVRMSN